MAHFVLVHGGFSGGWCWKKTKSFLESHGHVVSTPTLTGLGNRKHLNNREVNLSTHIQDIYQYFFFDDIQNAVLVGHSYAGIVITGVASLLPERIKQLIYLDALIPDNNDSLMSLVDDQTAHFFQSQAHTLGENWFIPPLLATNIMDSNDSRWFRQRATSQTLASFEQSISFDQNIVHKIPSSFIFCNRDAHTTLRKMFEKAQKLGWKNYEIDSDHFPMINHADKLSKILLELIIDDCNRYLEPV